MMEEMDKRLQELRVEFETGQRMMSDLVARQADLRASLLRISGAIQVLEELLQTESAQVPEHAAMQTQPVMTN